MEGRSTSIPFGNRRLEKIAGRTRVLVVIFLRFVVSYPPNKNWQTMQQKQELWFVSVFFWSCDSGELCKDSWEFLLNFQGLGGPWRQLNPVDFPWGKGKFSRDLWFIQGLMKINLTRIIEGWWNKGHGDMWIKPMWSFHIISYSLHISYWWLDGIL